MHCIIKTQTKGMGWQGSAKCLGRPACTLESLHLTGADPKISQVWNVGHLDGVVAWWTRPGCRQGLWGPPPRNLSKITLQMVHSMTVWGIINEIYLCKKIALFMWLIIYYPPSPREKGLGATTRKNCPSNGVWREFTPSPDIWNFCRTCPARPADFAYSVFLLEKPLLLLPLSLINTLE